MANESRLIELIEQAGDLALSNYISLTSGMIAKHLIRGGVKIPVNCKDCKHYDERICNFFSEWPDQYSTGHTVYMEPDDFCSYGERKDGGQAPQREDV